MLYIAYLDEFGHIGPFIHRGHPTHKTSPVFGLGGIVLPFDQVRSFATYFFQLKNRLLDFEIRRNGIHPAKWEKKGAALYTTHNVLNYWQLRAATNRLLNHITSIGGYLFYVGLEKSRPSQKHTAKGLYRAVLMEAIKRLDDFCNDRNSKFLMVLDQQEDQFRTGIVESSGRTMFGTDSRRNLIEPPIQAESHLYQTLQCADWICGLVGRYTCYCADPNQYQELEWADRYFSARLRRASIKSSIRSCPQPKIQSAILLQAV
jgi:hypothetical protein